MSGQLEGAALAYLAHVHAKEVGQIAAGLRETRAVADYLLTEARPVLRALHRLHKQGLVDCFEGQPLMWRLAPHGIEAAREILAKAEGRP